MLWKKITVVKVKSYILLQILKPVCYDRIAIKKMHHLEEKITSFVTNPVKGIANLTSNVIYSAKFKMAHVCMWYTYVCIEM